MWPIWGGLLNYQLMPLRATRRQCKDFASDLVVKIYHYIIVNASARPPVTIGCRALDARRSLDQVPAKFPDITGVFGKLFSLRDSRRG